MGFRLSPPLYRWSCSRFPAQFVVGCVSYPALLSVVDVDSTLAICVVFRYLQVIGPSFSESFDVFLPSVLKYTKGSRPASDRAMAVGCFAEVFESIGP